MTSDDTVTLLIGAQRWSGWQALRVTRGIEIFPSTFELTLTDYSPSDAGVLVARPGDACQLLIGDQPVVTGYVDRFAPAFGPGFHQVQIAGRSKCEDLLDCTVDLPGAQVSAASLLALAQKLAQPYGITVSALNGPGPVIPQMGFFQTQRVYEIVEEAARWAQMLVYDGRDGNLILAAVGSTQMASGFAQGVNVQSAEADFNNSQRYSEYRALITSSDFLRDYSGVGVALPHPNRLGFSPDTTIRHRVLSFVSEQPTNDPNLAQKRADWEKARRRGRSQAVSLLCDSWRDSAGALWAPNSLAPVDLPALRISAATWLISEVTFLRNAEGGTTAAVTLMPPEAFQPQPSYLYMFDPQVMAALASSGGAGTSAQNASQ